MEKEFIPYEEALALKELGFDEPCFGYYYKSNYKEIHPLVFNKVNSVTDNNHIGTPLWQQVFRWFREKHNLSGFIGTYSKEFVKDNKSLVDGQYYLYISPIISGDSYIEYFDSYEEAELACLRKLIEIIKSEKL